jgi:hypothetical protein
MDLSLTEWMIFVSGMTYIVLTIVCVISLSLGNREMFNVLDQWRKNFVSPILAGLVVGHFLIKLFL